MFKKVLDVAGIRAYIELEHVQMNERRNTMIIVGSYLAYLLDFLNIRISSSMRRRALSPRTPVAPSPRIASPEGV